MTENINNKIALLIPGTSYKRPWKSINECDLYTKLLCTLQSVIDKRYRFKIFFGIDRGDIIYDNIKNQSFIKEYIKNFNLDIDFIYMDIEPGYLSKMWNKLFDIAYKEGYDYFYQCGDDIIFNYSNMFHECVNILKLNNNIGLTGPYTLNGNTSILTQSFVSRSHMEIFGFYFPTEIKNWYIDNWITVVYQPNYFYPIKTFKIINDGGSERYKIEINHEWHLIVLKYKCLIEKFIQSNTSDNT